MKHKHHIMPRHLGGTNDAENLIEVSVKEHAQIHYNLWMLEGRWQDKVAWLTLSGQIGRDEAIRLARSRGGQKSKSKESNEKRSKSLKGRYIGSKNPMYGKPAWNSNKTKETDPRLSTIGRNISKAKSGKHIGKTNPNFRHGRYVKTGSL